MRLADFDYELPPDRIAQRPAAPRDSSRLMLLDRAGGPIQHRVFRDLPSLLDPADTLVLNETRVIPARLQVRKLPGGGRAELLLLERIGERTWQAMVGGKGLSPGRRLEVQGGPQAEVIEDLGGARRVIQFERPITAELERLGATPLPPYIHEPVRDPTEYQTVYARVAGSAAAPTAGLHFTPELLQAIQVRGVSIARITLHIGLDTFAPVQVREPRQHPIHSEWCSIPPATVEAIAGARKRGGRVVAVGTTVVRALETAALSGPDAGSMDSPSSAVEGAEHAPRSKAAAAANAQPASAAAPSPAAAAALAPFEGRTRLFILPGFRFRVVDTLLTNFHLPRSTLLMLVSAFAGRERVLQAYEIAKGAGYRFYSFGDAMLIL